MERVATVIRQGRKQVETPLPVVRRPNFQSQFSLSFSLVLTGDASWPCLWVSSCQLRNKS